MAILSRELRKILERAVLHAREIAEKGSAEAIVSFGVGDAKAPPHLDDAGKLLRRKLRAHGRQVGDKIAANDIQDTIHLAQECAYEHWHRMLFARFLAENDLLRHPDHGISLSLDECQDLAREQGQEVWELAGQFAQRMLPEIFRSDDPVLVLRLPAETRNKLLKVLNEIPRDIFLADDSLGWVYQFWQARKKEEVNAAGVRIGADEIAPVTQLFTEDYMVEFLLHNTLGAWWTTKRLREGKIDQKKWADCQSEDDCRRIVSIGPVNWKYLRFNKKEDGSWFSAAGGFEGWPKSVKELKVLDPCMGSGHFLVFALPILMAFRIEEEQLSAEDACIAVLIDNLFGLEIDPRCAQIAAFNLALSAWKLTCYQLLPELNLACSGLGLNTRKEDWLKLAGKAENLRHGMSTLYELFEKAPILGSLINPRGLGTDLFFAEFRDLQPLLKKALAEEEDEVVHELSVVAKGVAKAAEILSSQFTLVATNVPYLGQKHQDFPLKHYCEITYPEAKADLATCFVQRSLDFCIDGGTVTVVTPQNWLFLSSYSKLREKLLCRNLIDFSAWLGSGAFETIGGEVVNVVLFCISNSIPNKDHFTNCIDVSEKNNPSDKSISLVQSNSIRVLQSNYLDSPDFRISSTPIDTLNLLEQYAISPRGVVNGDQDYWLRFFWEIPIIEARWRWLQAAVLGSVLFGGRKQIIDWVTGGRGMLRPGLGNLAYGRLGIAVSRMSQLPASFYTGELYDQNSAVLVPKDRSHLLALWVFCSSPIFSELVRKLDKKLSVTPATLLKVPFNLKSWQQIASEKYPQGLPKPFSSDPTQWLFNGYPKDSDNPLHVAVARLIGYQWPRQTGSSFSDCPSLDVDGLEKFTENNGIICLTSLRGELAASDRLRKLLATAYGIEWTSQKEKELIAATGSKLNNFDDWLRDDFFSQHCFLFNQRPFVWHIWDGCKDGFHAFVNYHRLAEGGGVGRRTLESLLYSYLGDWITRQREAVKRNEAGADGRLAAALELQEELKRILSGEPPYDIFVRWKPLTKQAIGWEPDINDGVRMNIRPFMMANISKGKRGAGVLRDKPNIKWDKDRGNEPSRTKKDFPWFWGWDGSSKDFMGGKEFDGNRWNDCHYSNAFKRKART